MSEQHLTGGSGDTPMLDAATVVLLRDSEAGIECLMVRKNSGQAFGGMWVFPGGRVEDGDGTGLEGAGRAAVREAAEETGLVLDAAALVPISHWTPPASAPRRYATWFFLGALPDDAVDVIVDGGEIGDHLWTPPAVALELHAAGDIELVPPTWVTLQHLAEAGAVMDSATAAVEAAAGGEVERFKTRVVIEDGVLVTLWDPDAGYAKGELHAPGPRHRLSMDPSGWRYERSG